MGFGRDGRPPAPVVMGAASMPLVNCAMVVRSATIALVSGAVAPSMGE